MPRASTSNEVDELVDWLSCMSLNDPQYAAMFLHVCTLNLLAKDMIESLYKQHTMQVQFKTQQPPRSLQSNQFRTRPQIQEDRRPAYMENMMYFGCGETGHQAFKCMKLAKLINQDMIRRINGRVCWANGIPVCRGSKETWVAAINRQRPPTVNYVTIQETSWDHDYEPYDIEEEQVFLATNYEQPIDQTEPEDSYDQDPYLAEEAEVYAASRPERTTRGARKEFDGVFVPARNERYQQRAQTRSMDNNQNRVPAPNSAPADSVPRPVSANTRQTFQTTPPQPPRTSRPPGIPATEFTPQN